MAPVVLVLGMHRSGTSLLAHMLTDCGLALEPREELQNGDEQNPDGYFEPIHLVRANDALIQSHGGTWYTPPVRRLQEPQVAPELLSSMRARVDGWRARGISWVWKDPRLNATLPAWLPLLPPQVVIVATRNPAEVARSLRRRDGTPPRLAYLMWELNLRAALHNSRQAIARRVVRYEDLIERPRPTIDGVARFLADSGVVLGAAPRPDIAAVRVTSALRHFSADAGEFLSDPDASPAQKALYQTDPAELLQRDAGYAELCLAEAALFDARDELEAGIRAAWNEDHYALE